MTFKLPLDKLFECLPHYPADTIWDTETRLRIPYETTCDHCGGTWHTHVSDTFIPRPGEDPTLPAFWESERPDPNIWCEYGTMLKWWAAQREDPIRAALNDAMERLAAI